MKTKTMASLIAGTGMLLAAAPGFATTIDNINFPTNPGQHVFAGTVNENIVTNVGDELTGDGTINTIGGSTDFCASGSCSLTYQFGGFMLEEISDTSAKFSGGYVNFYANGDMDNPFLTTVADISKGSSEYTLEGTLTNGSTSQAQNTAVGLLSVTGGSGASIFDNNTYENGNDSGDKSDLLFNTSLSPEGDGSTSFSGSADGHYTSPGESVPEPSDLAILLFGLGLIGSSVVLRRRRDV